MPNYFASYLVPGLHFLLPNLLLISIIKYRENIQGIQRARQLAHELAILNFRLRLGQFCVECDVCVVRGTQLRFPPKCIENNF